MKYEKVGLANLCDGAAMELFDRELCLCLDNIADVNTRAKAKRKVLLEVTISPAEGRDAASVTIRASSKLAPANEVERSLQLGQEGRNQVAYQPKKQEPAPDNVTRPEAFNA